MSKITILLLFCVISSFLMAQDTIILTPIDPSLTTSCTSHYTVIAKDLFIGTLYTIGFLLVIFFVLVLLSLCIAGKPTFLYEILFAIKNRIITGGQFAVPGFQFGKNETKLITKTMDLEDSQTPVQIHGNPDNFNKVQIKEPNGILTKSTKAMAVLGGCVLQVTTEFVSKQGNVTTAEALTFVPNATIERDFSKAEGYRLADKPS